jgi:hypothetical protein
MAATLAFGDKGRIDREEDFRVVLDAEGVPTPSRWHGSVRARSSRDVRTGSGGDTGGGDCGGNSSGEFGGGGGTGVGSGDRSLSWGSSRGTMTGDALRGGSTEGLASLGTGLAAASGLRATPSGTSSSGRILSEGRDGLGEKHSRIFPGKESSKKTALSEMTTLPVDRSMNFHPL